MNYDVIGDVHGHCDALIQLLERLGYQERGGSWRKAGHQAVFVGDFIDRGPRQVETVRLVRSMVESGHALATMGNQFVFEPFWRALREHDSSDAWKQQFAASQKAALRSVMGQDTLVVLGIVFDRLYVLRNQLVHGGAT